MMVGKYEFCGYYDCDVFYVVQNVLVVDFVVGYCECCEFFDQEQLCEQFDWEMQCIIECVDENVDVCYYLQLVEYGQFVLVGLQIFDVQQQ